MGVMVCGIRPGKITRQTELCCSFELGDIAECSSSKLRQQNPQAVHHPRRQG